MYQSILSKPVWSILLALLVCGTAANANDLKKGENAPDFEGKTVDGKTVRLSDYKGKVVLLDFWATWCGPCRAETPNVINAYEQFHKLGFEIIGINMDKDKERMQTYMKKNNLQGLHTFSGKGWEDPIARQYQVSGIPTMIVLDKDQKVYSLNARGHRLQRALVELFGIADSLEQKAKELETFKVSGNTEGFEQAAEEFSTLLIADPCFLNELAWKWVNNEKTNYQAALIAAQKAHQLKPKATDILDTLAYAELRTGYYDKSVENFTECLNRGLSESRLRLATALAYRNQPGDLEKTHTIIQESVSAGSVNPYVEEAIGALRKSSLDKDVVEILNEQFQSHKTVTELLNSNNLLEPKKAKAFKQDAAYFNGHHYKVFRVKLNWEKARIRCREMGGYLASITSPEENDFIVDLVRKKSYPKHTCCWIGGKQNCSTRIWRWTTEEPFELNEKLVVEDRHEHYLNLRLESGLWEDYPNRGELSGEQWFVCEWSSLEPIKKDISYDAMPPLIVDTGSLISPEPEKHRKSGLKGISDDQKVQGDIYTSMGVLKVPDNISIELISPEHRTLMLTEENGRVELPQGRYRLESWTLEKKDDKGRTWKLSGDINTARMIEVGPEPSTLKIKAEPIVCDLKIRSTPSIMYFTLGLDGPSGERLRVSGGAPGVKSDQLPQPTFVIYNKDKSFEKSYKSQSQCCGNYRFRWTPPSDAQGPFFVDIKVTGPFKIDFESQNISASHENAIADQQAARNRQMR